MELIDERLDIDLIFNPKRLTKKEEKRISKIIRALKAKSAPTKQARLKKKSPFPKK